MALYRDRVFPRILDAALDTTETRAIRARVCAGLTGEVVEIGFGSGLNLPWLPEAVSRLYAVDPSVGGARLAAGRIRDSRVPVVRTGLDGQALPLPDASVDSALSTWTLCSVPDAVRALREIARVLRPGGRLHFVEHGAAPDQAVRRWQDRLDPLQRRLACGCHLNRDIPGLIGDAQLRIERIDSYYVPGGPRFIGSTYEGVATPG
jgi:ubiquinone/menaquinone biosynthesis C-methylase UbiE